MSIVLSDSMRSSFHTVDPYGSTKTCEKTNLIDLKAVYGICDYRDRYVTQGTGSVTNQNSRFQLSISGASDKAELISTERGTYVAGFSSECGIGLDVDASQFTGNETLDFGYFDDSDGYFFRMDQNGTSLHVRKAGTTLDIAQSDWNGDYGVYSKIPVGGGVVWLIQFTYYGYGSVLFSIAYADAKGAQINRLLHSYAPVSGLSSENPNLPIRCSLGANGTASPVTAYVGGRQFSIQGQFDPKFRVTQTEEHLTSVGTETTHIVSYKKNDAHKMCAMKMYQMDVVASSAICIYLRIATTLTGATYSASIEPPDCIPGVSGLVRDTDATSMTGGLLLYTKMLPGGYTSFEIPSSVNIDERNMSVACRALNATAEVNAVIRIKEYF